MKLRPDTKILDLAASPLLNDLNHGELLVYVRLVAATVKNGKRFKMKNADLIAGGERTVARALKSLEARGLLKLSFDEYNMRTIEVL